jgi:hypothetical protein
VFTKASLTKFKKSLKSHKPKLAKAAETGVKVVALYVLTESKKLTPVDTGNLVGGATVRTEGSGFETESRVVYVAEYAVYVHEILEAYHKPPTRAKFLEAVLVEHKQEMSRVFEAAVRRVLTKG